MGRLVMRLYSGGVMLAALASLIFVYAVPPPSMKRDRDGIPHLTPPVINPATGEAVPMGTLVKHYQGAR